MRDLCEAQKVRKSILWSKDFNKENYNIINHESFLLWEVRKDCNKIPTSCQSCLSFMGLDGAGIFSTCWKKEFMDKGGNPCIPSQALKTAERLQGIPRISKARFQVHLYQTWPSSSWVCLVYLFSFPHQTVHVRSTNRDWTWLKKDRRYKMMSYDCYKQNEIFN